MAGFIQDPIQFVNLIADNLRDRYQTGFPVLKELIQNTDDASASEFHFGLSPGMPGAAHPLLKGPGLFFINNGEFSPSDARGIRSFGQNSKAADQVSIGKFGLGMKSVFHFCEACFFLAHDGDRVYEEVLNPWSGTDSEQTLHQDWDEFTDQDTQVIRDHLSEITGEISSSPNQCFILWLPLRKKTHLILPNGEQTGSILSEFPGDDASLLDFLDGDGLSVKIAALIPMLRNVRRAAFWKTDRVRGSATSKFDIILGESTERPSLVEMASNVVAVSHSSQKMLKGRIRVIRNDANQALEFFGYEYFGWNPSLTAMHSHELWPNSYVRDDLGHTREAKDKVRPHGAAFFSRTPGTGQLITNWSVFLPLDEANTSETIRCDGAHDFRLTLHGHFFIDAGRQGVYGLDEFGSCNNAEFDSEEALRRTWNCELLRTAVLPLVLPALDAFCTELPLSDKTRTALSKALEQSTLLRQFRGQITAKQSWLREIAQDGMRWRLRNNTKKVLSLPAPPEKDPTRPWRVFQALEDIKNQYQLSDEDAPNIVHPDLAMQWNEQNLLDILESVDSKALFSESVLLDYFTSFLERSAGPYLRSEMVNKKLRTLFKEGMIRNGEDELGRNQQRVREIVRHLDEKLCFRIGNHLPAALLKRLFSIDTDIVLVPARFYPSSSTGRASLSVDDASRLLKGVQDAIDPSNSPNQEFQKATLNLSEQIINGVPLEYRKDLLRRCADLHVLGAFDCQAGSTVTVSPREIGHAKENGVLFGYSQGISPQERLGLAPILQDVIPNERILLINAETAKFALNQERSLPPCNGRRSLRTLGQKVRTLGDIKARTKLAGSVDATIEDIEIRGLRFLLHADINHFDDSDTLWILGEKQHPVWQKLWAQVIGDEVEPWNLLKGAIADRLPRNVLRYVGIKEISVYSVFEELEQRGGSMIDSSGFSKEECNQILREVKNDGLWRSLPFHWTLQDKPVRGDAENVYLKTGEVRVDDDLLQDTYLIPCSKDNETSRRQKALLKRLDESAIIKIALSRSGAPNAWRVLLDTLQSLSSMPDKLSPELVRHITNVAWVPSTMGALQKPDDIIDLEVTEAELDRILAQAPNTFTTPSRLELEFREHPYYLKFREGYFARGQEGLERLAQVLKGLDTYHIGNVAFKDSDELGETVHFLSSYEHPGWRFLAEIKNGGGDDTDLRPLVSSMHSQMSLEAIVKLLNWVADRGGNQEQASRVFNRYLRVFSRSEKADDAVCRLKLLNQAGCWVPSEKLVSDVAGVAAAHVLHHEQAQILVNVISNVRLSENTSIPSSEIDAGTRPQAAANVLRGYFQSWSGRVAPPLTGLFVLLFGADEAIKTLCKELLGQHSREWLIEQLPWQIPQGTELGGAKTWLSGFSREDALEYFRMNVRIHNANMLRVRSILGNLIQVGLDEEFDTLMVGKPSYSRLNNHNGYQVDLILRKIAVDQYSEKQLSSYLKHSTAYLLREVFNQVQPRLDTLWDELDKSDQVDIDLARSLILQNIPFYLKQLGVHKYHNLNSSLNRYREEERKEKEFIGTTKEEKYRKAKETALIELQHIIKSDEGAQKAILESVRHKIRDYQYQVEGVPFELFQNADDALHDLEMIDAYPAKPGDSDVEPLPPSICRFVVEVAEGRLVFMHWGRAINQFGSKGFQGRDRGYDRDLENMLILSASDKGEDVTGKFGLGFKSVWLVSDRPTVVSGRLQAEIVGGLLPIPVQNVASQNLRKRMSECQPDSRWPGTGIELPLVELGENEVLNQFSKLAGFMVAFARNIRTIDIKDGSGKTLSFSWECRKFPGCNNIYIGYVGHVDADLFVLKITLPDGAILAPVGTHGFEELPKEIPSLWVTAPIREQDHLGFAINAMFEVDAGRSRLSASLTENEKLPHRLGKQLAIELEHLRESVATKWEEIAKNMRFDPGVEQYHFWHSLWTVLMAGLPQMPRASSPRVIATSMLSEGMRTLTTEHDIVPNGLSGDLKRLIHLSDVKTVLKNALSDNCILETVAKASCFRTLFDTRTAVSPQLGVWLRILFPEFASNASQLGSLSLSDLFSQLDSDKAISPSDAKILGEALSTNILNSWQEPEKEMPHSHVIDLKRATEIARELRFISADRTAEKGKMLLTESYSEDETLRWAFAPDNNRLAGDYEGSAIEFFLFCRQKLEAPTERLKDWIIQAEGSDRRQAALKYLIEGELAPQVIDVLHKKGLGGTWLVTIEEDSEFLEGWDADSRSKLIYQILKSPSQSKDAWENYNQYITHPLMPIDAEHSLHKIYDWWKSERSEQLDKYRKKTYPEGQRLRLKIDDEGAFDRSSWLILLLLGGFHTMGRTQPEQHRTFIEICQRRGWWEIFIEPLPAQRFNDWMRVLDEYIDQQVDQHDYEQWMMRFPIIYKLSRHLDDYVELLLGLERRRDDFDLNLVLSPLVDADQQGGGIAAPSLGRTLGIGANFVIRELIRNKIIDSPHLRNHAYVPYERIRRLFSEMGCNGIESEIPLIRSPMILEFLTERIGEKKSCFCGDFDIPLGIVSTDLELQQQLLGRALTHEEEF